MTGANRSANASPTAKYVTPNPSRRRRSSSAISRGEPRRKARVSPASAAGSATNPAMNGGTSSPTTKTFIDSSSCAARGPASCRTRSAITPTC